MSDQNRPGDSGSSSTPPNMVGRVKAAAIGAMKWTAATAFRIGRKLLAAIWLGVVAMIKRLAATKDERRRDQQG